MREKTVYDHYARINPGFLHGGKEHGTEQLLSYIPLKGSEAILEIGFGTGATQVKIASRFPHCSLFGIDQSHQMLCSARCRLSAAFLRSDRLFLDRGIDPYPFNDDSFDLVVIESVLGIQSWKSLIRILDETQRVLKVGGTLAINESIWTEEVSIDERKRVNNLALKTFGFIQGQTNMVNVGDWVQFFKERNITTQLVAKVDEQYPLMRRNFKERLSGLISLSGALKQFLIPGYRRKRKNMYKVGQSFLSKHKNYLDAYIFVLINNK